jgi:hypothetical protein
MPDAAEVVLGPDRVDARVALLEHDSLLSEDAERIIEGAYARRRVPPHWQLPVE